MHTQLLQRFVALHASHLEKMQVRNVLCTAHGLVFHLTGSPGACEMGLLGLQGAAWAYMQPLGARDRLVAALREPNAGLAALVPELGWHPDDALALDALRAWLLRPAAWPPEWLQLAGTQVTHVSAPAADRILLIDFRRDDALGRREVRRLQAELFERSMNIILFDSDNAEIANWKARPGATPRPAPTDGVMGCELEAIDLLARAYANLADASSGALYTAHRRASQRRLRRLRLLLRNLDADFANACRAAEMRRKGELLTLQLRLARRGQTRVTVKDLYADGQPVEIELDPERSPQENVALFFKRARRGERGSETIRARREHVLLQIAALEPEAPPAGNPSHWASVVALAASTWLDELNGAHAKLTLAGLWAVGGPPWRPVAATPSHPSSANVGRGTTGAASSNPGRRFLLLGEWEVRVGRSNAENDVLTHRFARPDDVWLHASGVSGSHVVLRMQGRRDNPPRSVLEMAAAIAARYSKAKHAGTVPVVWTRKRYVRKPRGGKPGLAVCTHEKTLFVKPALPVQESSPFDPDGHDNNDFESSS